MLWRARTVLLLAAGLSAATAFIGPSRCHTVSSQSSTFAPISSRHVNQKPTTCRLNMFMGSEGGVLGVGAPEVFTILLVGYFVLGPSDLYKVVKEIGKFIQNFRTLGADLTKTVETNLESQLEIEEIRKAQRELTDAFSFRRTINVDDEEEAFSTKSAVASSEESSETAVSEGATKKKIRRRVKKKVLAEEAAPVVEQSPTQEDSGVVEDLDMTAAFTDSEPPSSTNREERMERLKESQEEQDRFAAQTSQDWNQQIMANEDKLSPLAKVMERLAILEEEKNAADERLEEEFRLRAQLEEKYYKEKRSILEEAAAEVQTQDYVAMDTGGAEGKSSNNNSTAMQA